MKVLLINPAYPFEESPTPPLGLISLAAYLLKNDIEVIIEDYIVTPYSKERLKSVINQFNPDIVGATGVTMNIKTSLQVLDDCKAINFDIITVMGGPHVTFDALNILSENNYIDYIIRGEGEITFTEFIKNLESGKSLKDVAGISFRDNKTIVHNEDRPFIEDINVLPYPARHLVKLSKYKAMGFPINMITSRGCPHKCIFCVGSKMVGRKVRNYDVKRVVDEFELLSKMGFLQINIVDDLFTANKKRCIAICDEIMRRGIKHKWNAFARVDTISEGLLLKLKESGCTTLCFGIESGNQEILDLVKKKTTLEKCKKAVNMCHDYGIEPMASYILGLPGENRETIDKTMKFAKELCPNHGFHVLAPFPGTEVREKSEEYGIKIMTNDWQKYDANRSICELNSISSKEIDEISDVFNSSAQIYVDELIIKVNKGEKIDLKDTDFLERIDIFCFSKDLILDQCIETYPGLENGADKEAIIDDFITYVKSSCNSDDSVVQKRVARLLDLNCIKIDNTAGNKRLVWV